MKFTPTTIATIVAAEGAVRGDDLRRRCARLGLRIRASGARAWVFQYKIGRQNRRVALGDASVISLAKARKAAADLHARVRLGGNPADEKAEAGRRAADTMSGGASAYLPYQKARLTPLSLKQNERHLLKHCKPLHAMQLAKIDRRTVSSRMAVIAAKSGPVEANRARSSLAAFFAWCIREGFAEHNPAAGGKGAPEKSRDRVLTDAELKAIWKATADGRDYSAIVSLLMLTGCRVQEVGGLRWSEVTADAIELPGTRTKNKRAHSLPHRRRRAPSSTAATKGEFVFGRGHDTAVYRLERLQGGARRASR